MPLLSDAADLIATLAIRASEAEREHGPLFGTLILKSAAVMVDRLRRADAGKPDHYSTVLALCMVLSEHSGGCVRNVTDGNRTRDYCDDCPSEPWCPWEHKEWSK